MTYIVSINTSGFPDMARDTFFDNYEEALDFMRQFESCHAYELEYRLYEADNEFTAKRRLLLEE